MCGFNNSILQLTFRYNVRIPLTPGSYYQYHYNELTTLNIRTVQLVLEEGLKRVITGCLSHTSQNIHNIYAVVHPVSSYIHLLPEEVVEEFSLLKLNTSD